MNSKNFNKKLTLNKKTIVILGKPNMSKVYGGTSAISICFPTCIIWKCAIVNPTDVEPLPMTK
jgi:hypothetical protein